MLAQVFHCSVKEQDQPLTNSPTHLAVPEVYLYLTPFLFEEIRQKLCEEMWNSTSKKQPEKKVSKDNPEMNIYIFASSLIKILWR